jgi:hypothetical protein
MNHCIDAKKLRLLAKMGRSALDGDSNDAEHDALYLIVEALEAIKLESNRRAGRPSSKESCLSIKSRSRREKS